MKSLVREDSGRDSDSDSGSGSGTGRHCGREFEEHGRSLYQERNLGECVPV